MREQISDQNILKSDFEEQSLRPNCLSNYIGQTKLKEMLEIYITTAKERKESLDHVLLFGPPGLGKTTLAYIISKELGSNIITTSGPALKRTGDIVSLLSLLEPGDVLFIDEIHRIPKKIEEILYSAMEDYFVEIIVGKDNNSLNLKIDLPPFTLIGATTRFGDLTNPLRDRFGIIHQLNYYNNKELQKIVERTAKIFNYDIEVEAIVELVKRSRGTPRIANRLFKRVRDFAQYHLEKIITYKTTVYALNQLNIDIYGLDDTDRKYLKVLIEKFNGGPVGLEALAATLALDKTTLEEVNEPYLLKEGFIIRTPRGRLATAKAYKHLKIKKGGII